MGADLYIEEIHKGDYHCYDGESSIKRGYYRDSYNRTNLLWQLDLSYWELLDNKKMKFDRNGKLKKNSIKYLKTLITKNYSKKDWNDLGDRFDFENGDEQASKEEWINYFKKKYKELIMFLDLAIDNNYRIIFSV